MSIATCVVCCWKNTIHCSLVSFGSCCTSPESSRKLIVFEILHRYRFFHTKKKLSLSINGELELRNVMKTLKTLDYCIVLIIGSGWFSMVLNSIAWYCLPTHIFSKFLESPIDKVFIHCCKGKLYPAYASS